MMGQALEWSNEAQQELDMATPGGDAFDLLMSAAKDFRANYTRWSAGGLQDLQAAIETMQAARTALGVKRAEVIAAGDKSAETDLTAMIDQADADLAAARDALSQAQQYGGTWDYLAGVLTSVGGAVGLSLAPILLAISAATVAASLAALAYVVTAWVTARRKASFLSDVAGRLQRGELSTDQAKVLAENFEPASSGFFAGIGTAGIVAALALGYLFIVRGKT